MADVECPSEPDNNDDDRERLIPEGFLDITGEYRKSNVNAQNSREHHESNEDARQPAPHQIAVPEIAQPQRKRWWQVGVDRVIELVFTFGIVIFAYLQWRTTVENNISTSKQVDKIIIAAAGIKDSAEQMKNAAWNFKGSAEGIDGNINNAVRNLQAQADQMRRSAGATENAAQTTRIQLIDYENMERANLVITQVIDPTSQFVTFTVKNNGNSPALEINQQASVETGPLPWPTRDGSGYPPESALENKIHPIPSDKGGFTLQQGEHRDVFVVLPPLNTIDGHYSFAYINIGYKDIFGCIRNAYSCSWSHISHGHRFQECYRPINYPEQPCHK